MGNRIITIDREFESGGNEIAQAVAERLSLPYYDRFLITASADESGVKLDDALAKDEKLESRFEYSQAQAAYYYTSAESPLPTGARVAQAQFELIRKIAAEGPCVIVGRCAGYILRERGDVISVFVHAGRDRRIQRTMSALRIEEKEAVRILKQTDRMRKAYHKNYTGMEWNDPNQYHMLLNSDLVAPEACVEMICALYQAP